MIKYVSLYKNEATKKELLTFYDTVLEKWPIRTRKSNSKPHVAKRSSFTAATAMGAHCCCFTEPATIH